MGDISVTTLNGREDCVDAIEQIIVAADKNIAIFSQRLEPLLYNRPVVCDKISLLARSNRHARIRILTQSSKSVLADGHCFISLAQRLSSYIQIRNPNTQELRGFAESWLIIDNHTICELNNPDRYEGSLVLQDLPLVKEKLEFFDYAWENSDPDPNVRRLHI